MKNAIKISQRHLPHWEKTEGIYFVTFSKKENFFKGAEQQIIFDHIRENDGKYYDLFVLAVMINHVHLNLKLNMI